MKAGFGEKNITPEPGTERAGSYQKMYVGKERDQLKARASVFDDGKVLVAIVGIDCCMIGKRTADAAKKLIYKSCRIKPENIMIAASHTHSGGSLWGFYPDELTKAPELVKEIALKISPSVDIAYEKIVIRGIHGAVKKAFKNRKESTFSIGRGHEGAAVFNRRFKMKSGLSFTHPGKGNSDIKEAAGPIDPEVGVIGVWDTDGSLSGCIVNYACHGTAYSRTNASADWICAMEQTIRGSFQKGTVVVFLNGASGDITQVDNMSRRKNNSPEEWLDIVGKRVGAEAVKVLVSSEKGQFSTLSSAVEKLVLKRRISDHEKTKEAVDKFEAFMKTNNRNSQLDVGFIWAKERIIADYIAQKEPFKTVEIQALQIGPAVFMANPAEYFCSLGLAIKKACIEKIPFPFVVELANDTIGYVPDEEAFSESGGGYETRITGYSNLEISAGRKIADCSVRLALSLPVDKEPEGPMIEKSMPEWSYGNNPPELD